SRSTGGRFAPRTASAGRDHTIATSSAPSSTSGTSANSTLGTPGTSGTLGTLGTPGPLGVTLNRPEQAHPAEFGELALMGVEHEIARIPERRLDDGPLALTQHQRVGLFARCQRRPRAEDVEEHPVHVQAVDKVKLGDVD